ncbi:hypothetical protein GCM10027418_28630 [Mariniluteicoccus endophyticus]
MSLPPPGQQPPGQPYAGPPQQAGQPQMPYGPHAYTRPVVVPAASTGAISWWAGLLVFALVPFLSSVVAGAVMVVVGRSQKGKGPVAVEIGRGAANWGLTYLIATVLLVGTHFVLLFTLAGDRPSPYADSFFPIGIPITLWLVVTLAHIVVSIVGGVRAGGGRPTHVGIPFFRA